jgi:hypothetical protein
MPHKFSTRNKSPKPLAALALHTLSDYWHRTCEVTCSNWVNGDPEQDFKDKGVPLHNHAAGRLFYLAVQNGIRYLI